MDEDEVRAAALRRFASPKGSPEALAKAAKGRETVARRKAEALALATHDALVSPEAARQWTPERQLLFINALGETGRVDKAVRIAGMKFSSLYALRRRDPAFATAWADALAAHGELAEAIVLDTAINGYDPQDELPPGRRRVMSERLMVEVLRTRRARAVALAAAGVTGIGSGQAGESARLKIEARLTEISLKLAEGGR